MSDPILDYKWDELSPEARIVAIRAVNGDASLREQVDAIVRSEREAAQKAFHEGHERGYQEGWQDGYDAGWHEAQKPEADRK